MKWIVANCLTLCVLIVCQVLAAPSSRYSDEEGDSIEQELDRHHHATADDKLTSQNTHDSDELDDPSPVESYEDINESEGEDEDEGPITEDEMYDITVGDVIRDVLLTLQDNPDIVKQLIASERDKLAEQINAFNNLVDDDSVGDDLAGFMKPAEQLNNIPMSVEKKAGRSGMADIASNLWGSQADDKRADEVSNDEYTRDIDSEQSREYNEFMHRPREGGEDDPMFDYDKQNSVPPVSEFLENDNEDTGTEVPDSEEVYDSERMPFRLPIFDPRNMFSNYGTSDFRSDESNTPESEGNASAMSTETRIGADDTTDNRNNGGLSSEEELAWLLQRGRTKEAGEISNQSTDNESQSMKM